MKPYPIWKPIVVLLVLAAAALLIYPPGTRLKPGLDLAGGTTLIYDVRIPENYAGDPAALVDSVIAILRDRVDPGGVRNLVWRRQAGNRIEIQMALATAETGDRRDAYDRTLGEFLAENVSEEKLDNALRMPPAERGPALAALAREGAQSLDRLEELAAAYDNMRAIERPYAEAQRAFREAERRLNEVRDDSETAVIGPQLDAQLAYDEALAALQPLAADVADARAAFDPLREAVLAQNVEPYEIESALELSPDPELGETISARERALEDLKAEHPDRVEGIDRVAEAWAFYEEVKGPLDDPNDLIALLQTSGVLELRIAATPQDPVDFSRYYERLEETGPRAGLDEPYRWFEIDNLQRFEDDPDRRRAIRENPRAALAGQGLVGAGYRGRAYVLLANTPDRAMTQDEDWRLASAQQSQDELGKPAVGFDMDPRGATALARITGPNVGKPMAILLDGGVITTPTLQARLSRGGIITGNFDADYVDFLIRTLNSGSLDATLGDRPILIKTIGPALGADNLEKGLTAAVLALVVVAVFMVLYYFYAGAVATVALAANMLIILGLMAMFRATFTLPGIAGIVLTIGMAVDANVLIFERVREEMKSNADIATAVRLGFDKALSTILDANLTTFITAVVLFYTATAEIKGFATTLMCGILATLFTSLILSRVLVDAYVRLLRMRKLPMLPTVVPAIDRALTPGIDWVGKRYAFFVVSAVLMGAGLGMVGARGVEMLDIEFRAGTQVSFEVDRDLEGREVTPPESIGVAFAGEAPLVPIEEVRARLALTAAAAAGEGFPGDVEPTPERRAVYDRLVAVAEGYERRYAAEAEAFAASGDPEDDPGPKQEMALLADASVVTQGDAAGSYASGFTLATLVQDSRLVSDVVKASFFDLIDEPPRVRFAGIDAESHLQAPVFAITETDDGGRVSLGASINRLDVRADVEAFLGGAAVVMEDLQPAVAIEDLEERLNNIRRQPPFDERYKATTDVIGLDAAGVDDDGRTLYRTAAVLAIDPQTAGYVESPGAFERGDGVAALTWELAREAATRDASLQSVASFSSQVSGTMRQAALVAMALSLLAVVAYVWFRFGSVRYGLAAIAALVHDVSVALGLLAISGWLYDNAIGHFLLLTDFKVDLAIVAAMLTIVGYSLNDTIVVFDRIRENRGKLAVATPEIVNRSINQTISRTVLTSGTTLLAVAILYGFGGPGVHGFAFAMIIGVLVGTYSSVAIASPALLVGAKRKAPAEKPAPADRGPAAAPAA